jgi:hypothetical protein
MYSPSRPVIGVLEAESDFARQALELRVLRMLALFGHGKDPYPPNRFLAPQHYRKTPLYDRFFSFDVRLEGEHIRARGSIIEEGWYKGIRTPVRLSRTPASLKSAPPKFSQHAREVLREHGFDDAAIERLAASGVVVEERRAG